MVLSTRIDPPRAPERRRAGATLPPQRAAAKRRSGSKHRRASVRDDRDPQEPAPIPIPLTRRAALLGGLAAPALARAGPAPQRGLAALAGTIRPALVERTLAALARHEQRIWSRDVIAIADFALPSSVPRLHLVDLLADRVTTMLVAHGRGSDPDHGGMLRAFSNVEGSAATSEGAYLTGQAYSGVHGAARRLIGLDSTNDAAEARAIVIHSAWYVGPEIVARQGMLGRSDGCFAVSSADIGSLLARLGRGRLLYAG